MTPAERTIAELSAAGYWVGGLDRPTFHVGDTVTTRGFSPMVGRIVDIYGVSAVVRIDGRTVTYSLDRIVRVDA